MPCTRPNLETHRPNHHLEVSNEQFINDMEKGGFPPNLFTHEAHIRLAWLYLNQFDEKVAIEKTCHTIQNFNQLHGDGTKFHLTLTVASVKVVQHFKKKSKATTFIEFINENPRLIQAFQSLVLKHYGSNPLTIENAKTEYVAPGLLPFD
ncbi:hypothetical protein [Flagellimonas zhangzhouensis]|uniref:Uncharacterized protein n=1 Tax=Flagellimonas zhangzhouensis TaxID=1073328 RepID=A0A1H2SRL7_9FLAO|nr:hypothetical protein [Allomuricauda zhangzhouensis]SDQ78300.1 hypothetical protein SAMN05216294_2585 [Allomuricauda zhangzhouensis]SDW34218.1 hypothetical protein SAMN04487892_1226 [Allomuricauda zhangzhouensis]